MFGLREEGFQCDVVLRARSYAQSEKKNTYMTDLIISSCSVFEGLDVSRERWEPLHGRVEVVDASAIGRDRMMRRLTLEMQTK